MKATVLPFWPLLLSVLAVDGCAASEPLAGIPLVPSYLQVCPDPAIVPLLPPRIRTVEAVGAWAVKTDAARSQTEQARVECAHRLDQLNDWIASLRKDRRP